MNIQKKYGIRFGTRFLHSAYESCGSGAGVLEHLCVSVWLHENSELKCFSVFCFMFQLNENSKRNGDRFGESLNAL